MSANHISALCPVDQWECSHFLVHNLFAFLRTFPWLNCMLKNVIILIGPLAAELYIREQTLAFCRKVRAKGLKQLATHYCVILHNQIKVFSFMYNSLKGWRFDWLSRVRLIFESSCLIFHDICLPTHKPELNGHSPTISCKSAPKIENWKNYVNRHHGKYEYTSFCKNT